MKGLVDFVAEKYGDQPCFGQRSNFDAAAVWSTYRQTRRDTLAFGSALRSILPSGAIVGLYGRNSPEWVYSELACGYFGWVALPLYDTLGDEAMDHILNQTEVSLVVCDTFERAQSLIKRGSRYLRYLVVIKMDEDDRQKLMKKVKDSVAIFTFAEMMVRGLGKEENVPEPNPDDLFLVCYTSGSTGLPKGVMCTHQTFLNAISTCTRLYEISEISVYGNVHVSFLPLAHIFEQVGMATSLMCGSQIAFLTTDFTRLLDDYAYYRPTLLASVPRVLSRLHAAVMEKVTKSKLKSLIFERAIKSKLEEQKRGIFKQCGILDSLCFRPIRNRLGGRVRGVVCGGAPLQPEVLRFVRSVFSCPVAEAYGSTESGGMVTMTLPTDMTGGHAGCVVSDVKIKLIDVPSMGFTVKRDGIGEATMHLSIFCIAVLFHYTLAFQICVLARTNTPGYYKDSEKTKELFDEDGFVRMGDVGRWTECGTLQIVDRCKSIFKLSQGEYVAPERVEQIYALSPLVLNVYVDGSSLYSYTVAVVVPNFERIQKLLPELFDELLKGTEGDSKKCFAEACRQTKLKKMILNDLNKLGDGNGLKGFEKVRDLHLSPEPFSIENGLLTPTLKIARPQVRKHFAAQIQALYVTGNS
ncbi:AMP-binding enzyme [Opisthorchis viverrini]|uniref:long-chain-fatty-acid--CoA ligase n=1 Tax=Opisthorchis viverrini TaxID=6198 RepID=A0A1S8WY16_OPIVI|nr:AMP-binding enzyme [Opisthorchis viverrini]